MKQTSFKVPFLIALRYLFSKKKHNIINIISIVSTIGIMASTAALIIVLSVFNGMEGLISNCFNAFNPDFKITLSEGKSFPVSSFPLQAIAQLDEVKAVEEIVSDMALITYQDRQILVNLKGVSQQYATVNGLHSLVIDGDFSLQTDLQQNAVLGAINAGTIQLNLNSPEMLKIYYPKRTKKNLSNPVDAFHTGYLSPTGVFGTNTEYDDQYIFCSLDFAREMMDYEGEATSIEVILKDPAQYARCQAKIEKIAGKNYVVQNKYQQEELLFKTMKSEKLIIYIILAFILLVATFNIIGTLGMLIIEKRPDIAILNSLGANRTLIQQIFVIEGLMISFLGGITGMLIGFIVCFIQQTFHVIKLGGGEAGYIIPYYPVEMHFSDFAVVLFTILVISLLTSWLPTRNIKKIAVK